MRWAAARAASRLGSSMMIRSCSPRHGAAARTGGIEVVLPAPGGATTTALANCPPAGSVARCAQSAGRISRTGRPSAMENGSDAGESIGMSVLWRAARAGAMAGLPGACQGNSPKGAGAGFDRESVV